MRSIEVGGTATVYFNVLLADNVSPALAESGGQPQLSINGGSFQDTGMSPLSVIGYGRYYSTLDASLVSVQLGDVLLTRYRGVTTSECAGDTFVVGELITAPESVQYYGSLQDADLFFDSCVEDRAWQVDNARKIKALKNATRLINALSFIGTKTDPLQPMAWPRNYNDDVGVFVPTPVIQATYLCAYALLDGYDPEIESNLLTNTMTKNQAVQTFYDRSFAQPWKLHGIPSSEAWRLLHPFLRDPNDIVLTRG